MHFLRSLFKPQWNNWDLLWLGTGTYLLGYHRLWLAVVVVVAGTFFSRIGERRLRTSVH